MSQKPHVTVCTICTMYQHWGSYNTNHMLQSVPSAPCTNTEPATIHRNLITTEPKSFSMAFKNCPSFVNTLKQISEINSWNHISSTRQFTFLNSGLWYTWITHWITDVIRKYYWILTLCTNITSNIYLLYLYTAPQHMNTLVHPWHGSTSY